MFRVAICDNEKSDIETMRLSVEKWMGADEARKVKITEFSESRKLYEVITASETGCHEYDLFLLDIMMPEISGISLGRLIREKQPAANIIYTTSSTEYALEAYGVQAIRYLLKPIRQEEIASALDTALALCQTNSIHTMLINDSNMAANIVIEDIMYVENSVRTLSYVMRGGRVIKSIRRNGTFEEAIAPLLELACFVQPHKSYFVNMNYVQSLILERVLMENGVEIPITRRRRSEVRSCYLQFIAKGV